MAGIICLPNAYGGGQESLTIKEIIESGKYNIKGYALNLDNYMTFPQSVTVTNQAGYLIYCLLKSPWYIGTSYNMQFDIDTGIAKKTGMKIYVSGGEYDYFEISNLDTQDYKYSFEVDVKDYMYNLLKNKYTFPSSNDLNKYFVNSDSNFNVNNFPSITDDVTTRWVSYPLIKMTKLSFTVKLIRDMDIGSLGSFDRRIIVAVYAIPK